MAKQITDNEKIILSGISPKYSIDNIDKGNFIIEEFQDDLAMNTARFKGYTPDAKIVAHLRTRAKEFNVDNITPCDVYRNTSLYDKLDNIVLMTEIQLKNIVNCLGKESTTGTDGDEFNIKDGIKVSKFYKEAMEIGFDVGEELKRKVFDQFTSYFGENSVFPLRMVLPRF